MKLRLLHQTFLHTNTYIPFTQTHLDTDAFIHRRFYTQAPLHTDAFTCRRFYTHDTFTQTLLDTDAFTHRRF
jgi:hypothetical protein